MTQQVQYIFTHFIYTQYYVFQYIQKNHNLKVHWKKKFCAKGCIRSVLGIMVRYCENPHLQPPNFISFDRKSWIPQYLHTLRIQFVTSCDNFIFCIIVTRDETLFSCFLFYKGILNINKIHNPFSRQNILIGIWNT